MTYETNVRAYKNIPFEYRLKKDGYYDIKGSLKGGLGVFNLEFQTYNGLNMTYEQLSGSPMVVKANAGQLPDLTHISGVTGCLKEVGSGHIYSNFVVTGSPTINKETGVVSNFGTGNYLTMPQAFPSSYSSMDIIFKGDVTNFNQHQALLSYGYMVHLDIRSTTKKFTCYLNNATWVDGTNVLSTGVTYWFRVIYDGKNYKGYTLVDDNYTLDTLPDISQWRTEWTTTISAPFANNTFNIGWCSSNANQYWTGNLDLSGCQIKIDNSVWWSPSVPGYIAKVSADNFILIGSPTIDSDKVVSNFSNSNYLNVDETIPSSYTSMDIIFKANFTSLTSHNCLLGTQSGGNWFGTRNTGYFATYSGSWVTGTTVLSTGTDYWFRVINNGTTSTGYLLVDDNYTLDTLPDISQWSQEWTTTNYNIKNQKLRVGYNGTSGEYCSGSIDLKGCNINIDGNDFWNPLVINTTVDGLLPSGVTDDGSAQTWNLFYNNGDYLLNTTSTMTGYTWVGSVAIPAHTV